MSWHDLLLGSTISHRPSVLESDRFGVEVDRIIVPLGADVSTPDLLVQISQSSADVTVLRYPADRVELYAELLATGRTAVFADTLVYWRLDVGSGHRPAPDPEVSAISVPVGQGARDGQIDEALLDDLVGDIFRDYGSHYLANPLFDPGRALAGYQEWARHSALHGGLVALRFGDEVVAVATLDRTDDVIEIELAGVRASARKQGLYPRLLAGVEDQAADTGVSQVLISTQGHNVRVQRAWSRYGLEPVATFVTVHLVRSGLLPAR